MVDGQKCGDRTSNIVPGMHRTELWIDSFFDEKDIGITEAYKLEFKLAVQIHQEDFSTIPFDGYEDQTFTVTSW